MRKLFGPVLMILLICLLNNTARAIPIPDPSTYLLPMTCSELLPDMTPYIAFFESLGRGTVTKDRRFSKRIFRILALREKIQDIGDRSREQNPVDMLMRKTLCFYREQKEPLKPVPYDDPEFTKFIKASLGELEGKIDDAVYHWEFERQERKEYERRALKNQSVVESVMREANIDADRIFNRLSANAKRKVKTQ